VVEDDRRESNDEKGARQPTPSRLETLARSLRRLGHLGACSARMAEAKCT
jgi:hypothetical protein